MEWDDMSDHHIDILYVAALRLDSKQNKIQYKDTVTLSVIWNESEARLSEPENWLCKGAIRLRRVWLAEES